jgi:hypothetical protein
VATATIMLAVAATMLTSASWPQVLYAIGLGISLAAGVQYAIRTQGGLTSSKPS